MVVRTCRRPFRALAACAALALVAQGCRKSGGDSANSGDLGPRQIVALGRLEPAGGVLEISAIPGDVLQQFSAGVEEGAVVEAGAELARVKSYNLRAKQLDAANMKIEVGRKQRERDIALAQANLQQALAAQAEVEAKLDEIEAQGLALSAAAESAQIAQADYDKLVELQASDPELVTEHQLRRQRNLADRAIKEYEVQKATHDAALNAANAAVAAGAKNVDVAKLSLQLAYDVDPNAVAQIEQSVAAETLEQSILRAPQTVGGPAKFTVLKRLVEPGEFITQIPVLQIADLSRMVCIAEVYEADAKEIKPGQTAVIHSEALAPKYALNNGADGKASGGIAGEVIRVGTMVSSGGLIQRNPLAPSDRSIIEVLIAIDSEDEQATAEAAVHVGLQVTVYFGDKPGEAPGDGASAAAP